jgi:hypothetical protein
MILSALVSSACRVVRPKCGLVSWIVMRLRVSFSALAVVAALLLFASPRSHAQSQGAQTQSAPPQSPVNGTYVTIDPLANVHYDERYDLSLGLAYDHMKAGPTLLQGSNLGGLDLSGTYWLSQHWGIEGSGRGYLGTSGAAPNTKSINGPFVAQYFFVGGGEWLGPHNKHGALIAHAMFGGVYGDFQKDLRGNPPYVVDFYNNQVAPAAIAGGHFDLNRSAHWVFRITPDAVMTHYTSTNATGMNSTHFDVNFAISVGAEYRFKKKR